MIRRSMCMTRLYDQRLPAYVHSVLAGSFEVENHATRDFESLPPSTQRARAFFRCVVPILYAQKEGACKLHVPREAETGPFTCCAPEPSGNVGVNGPKAIRRFLQLQDPSTNSHDSRQRRPTPGGRSCLMVIGVLGLPRTRTNDTAIYPPPRPTSPRGVDARYLKGV